MARSFSYSGAGTVYTTYFGSSRGFIKIESVSFDESTGKITILNFWGVWCPYCLYEMPALDEIANDFSDKVTVIAVHSSSSTIAKSIP